MPPDPLPVVTAQMLIRRPPAEVFDAFVDPEVTTRFWFTESSGALAPDATVRWTWGMYEASGDVRVVAFEPHRRLRIEWNDPPLPVEWTFEPHGPAATLVRISTWGFPGGDGLLAQALDSMGGFTLVLAGAKAYLEHGLELNLVADHHPPRS